MPLQSREHMPHRLCVLTDPLLLRNLKFAFDEISNDQHVCLQCAVCVCAFCPLKPEGDMTASQ